MKLIKKQISGITNFYINNLSISLDVSKRYNINLWSEGTQKQGAFSKTLYFDDTLEEWRMRDHNCENKNKSLDFSAVIEENTLKSLETLKAYGVDNGGIAIFNEVYFEIYEINAKINDLIITRYFSTGTFNVNANSTYIATINYTVPTGYKFLAVSNLASSGNLLYLLTSVVIDV